MWYIIFEIPGGLILFALVLLMAISDGVGTWVMQNIALLTAIIYITEGIVGLRKCIYSKKTRSAPLFISVPFTALSIIASTQYLMLVVAELAGIATGGAIGLLGLILAAPLALFTCVICKAPGAFMSFLSRDKRTLSQEGLDTTLYILDGVITTALCLLCRWFYGYI